MNNGLSSLGTVLVILGIVFVVLNWALGYWDRPWSRRAPLLHLGVILIGIGVLVGVQTVHS